MVEELIKNANFAVSRHGFINRIYQLFKAFDISVNNKILYEEKVLST